MIGAAIGLLATAVTDVGGIIGIRIGLAGPVPRRTGYHLIGRWFGNRLRRKFTHACILDTPPLPRETMMGLLVHYAIGCVLGVALWSLLLFRT